jgi:hypothetical protein
MGSSTVVAHSDTVVDAVSIGAFRYGLGYPNSHPLHSDADLHVDLIANSHGQPNSDQRKRQDSHGDSNMRRILLPLIALLCVAVSAFGQAFNFPDSPTLNQQVTGPNAQIYQWDGTKWTAAGGSALFLPINNPIYTGQMAGANGIAIGAGPLPTNMAEPLLTQQSGPIGAGTYANYYGGIQGGYGSSQGSSLILASGAYYSTLNPNPAFVATYPNASTIQLYGQSIDFTVDGGNPGTGQGVALTPGTLFNTSTQILSSSVPVFRFWAHNREIVGFSTDGGASGQASAISVIQPKLTSGTGLYSAVYVDYCDPVATANCSGPNDSYLVMQNNGPGSTVATPLSALIQTSAKAGLQINSLIANQPLGLYSGGQVTINSQASSSPGLNILTGSLYLNGANQFQTGTWTPTFACASGNPTIGGGGTQGYWAAVGNMVFVSAHMGWSSASGGSGQGEVGGLPFPVIDSTGNGTLVGDILFDNAAPASGGSRMIGSLFNGNSVLQTYETNFGSMGYLYPLPCANLYANSPSNARFNGWYRYR